VASAGNTRAQSAWACDLISVAELGSPSHRDNNGRNANRIRICRRGCSSDLQSDTRFVRPQRATFGIGPLGHWAIHLCKIQPLPLGHWVNTTTGLPTSKFMSLCWLKPAFPFGWNLRLWSHGLESVEACTIGLQSSGKGTHPPNHHPPTHPPTHWALCGGIPGALWRKIRLFWPTHPFLQRRSVSFCRATHVACRRNLFATLFLIAVCQNLALLAPPPHTGCAVIRGLCGADGARRGRPWRGQDTMTANMATVVLHTAKSHGIVAVVARCRRCW